MASLGALPLLVSHQEQALGAATVALATTETAAAIGRRRPLAGAATLATSLAAGALLIGPGRARGSVRAAVKGTATVVPGDGG